jgi:hypothetical protein
MNSPTMNHSREHDFNSLEEQPFVKFYLRRNRTTNYNVSFPVKIVGLTPKNKFLSFLYFYLFIIMYNNMN